MLAFANLLPQKHPKFWSRLDGVLRECKVDFALIDDCKDIWVRDFMPIKLESGTFVSYRYEPNYLAKYPELRTQREKLPNHLDLILDGGNFVHCGKRVLMCEKILSENRPLSKNQIVAKIKEIMQIEEVIFLPKVPYDRYGHSDGMARWIEPNHLLVNDFTLENTAFQSKLQNALEGIQSTFLHYPKTFWEKYKWGAYVNFVAINNLILLPVYGIAEDKVIQEQFEKIFADKDIIPIVSCEIIKSGGALHCISTEVAC
ncbi:hypothetical protein BBW65_07190 [Helicobacter enhydrae]|uniref:Agmatine deiminase n=1 Tax=Helicobacter enhydrae TaxID=222136 RepID=A0A1B1U789_9HELI|nr:agmatine deiminase family protein [Helicobacter enhydrae]ANV98591.1 hypothetical protein BBW65_07190 [Helicobacter enhydrae]